MHHPGIISVSAPRRHIQGPPFFRGPPIVGGQGGGGGGGAGGGEGGGGRGGAGGGQGGGQGGGEGGGGGGADFEANATTALNPTSYRIPTSLNP